MEHSMTKELKNALIDNYIYEYFLDKHNVITHIDNKTKKEYVEAKFEGGNNAFISLGLSEEDNFTPAEVTIDFTDDVLNDPHKLELAKEFFSSLLNRTYDIEEDHLQLITIEDEHFKEVFGKVCYSFILGNDGDPYSIEGSDGETLDYFMMKVVFFTREQLETVFSMVASNPGGIVDYIYELYDEKGGNLIA